MSAELAIGAALVALQHQQTTEALLFLERAREFYSPSVFRELINDSAFDPYRTDPKMKSFFTSDRVDKSLGAPETSGSHTKGQEEDGFVKKFTSYQKSSCKECIP